MNDSLFLGICASANVGAELFFERLRRERLGHQEFRARAERLDAHVRRRFRGDESESHFDAVGRERLQQLLLRRRHKLWKIASIPLREPGD